MAAFSTNVRVFIVGCSRYCSGYSAAASFDAHPYARAWGRIGALSHGVAGGIATFLHDGGADVSVVARN